MSQVFLLHHCPQNGKSKEAYRLTVVLRWFSSQKKLGCSSALSKKSAKQKDAWFLSCKILHTPAGTWFPKSGSNKSCFRVPSKRRIYLPVSWRLITVACPPHLGTLVVTRMGWKGSWCFRRSWWTDCQQRGAAAGHQILIFDEFLCAFRDPICFTKHIEWRILKSRSRTNRYMHCLAPISLIVIEIEYSNSKCLARQTDERSCDMFSLWFNLFLSVL